MSRRSDVSGLPSAADARLSGGRCPVTGKCSYASRAAAKAAKRIMMARGLDVKDLTPYVCNECGGMHLGTRRYGGECVTRHALRCIKRQA